jgi:hypothetical protein
MGKLDVCSNCHWLQATLKAIHFCNKFMNFSFDLSMKVAVMISDLHGNMHKCNNIM